MAISWPRDPLRGVLDAIVAKRQQRSLCYCARRWTCLILMVRCFMFASSVQHQNIFRMCCVDSAVDGTKDVDVRVEVRVQTLAVCSDT